ncbi:MAG: GntR family transcriptional regulator [Pseudomonadota bacterium]|nr:GntR family transcriptional regulator [Pseudomonadota bacterium]
MRDTPRRSRGSLYQEVMRQLIDDIQRGVVGPGDALPSESELAQRFKVSIGTLRRAVDGLVADNILVRQQGRGTFVGRQDRDRFMFQFFKIAARDGTLQFPEVRLHAFQRSRPNEIQARRLGIQLTDAVFCIDNVLALGGRPVVHDHIVIPAALFDGLNRIGFAGRTGTIYELYQSDFGVTIVGAHERIRAESMAMSSASLLGLRAGVPALRIERLAYTFNTVPVEFRVSVVDTREFEYVSDLEAPV